MATSRHHILAALTVLLHIGCLHCFVPIEHHARDNWDAPCKFYDSINVTGLSVAPDSAVTLDNFRYAADLIGDFDYEFVNETFRQSTSPHRRACVCQRRPCVRLMCNRNSYFDGGECVEDTRKYANITIQTDGGDLRTVDLFEQFGYTVGRPCVFMTPLEPNINPADKWRLHENGSITTEDFELNQHQYTLSLQWNETTKESEIEVAMCFELYEGATRYTNLAIGMLMSVPFLILTFTVYAILPELRNVHGKSLMCYLSGLANAYAILGYLQIYPSMYTQACKPLGYAVYFWFMVAFFWLNVISFDLWWNFRGIKGINKMNENRKFLVYSAYAWGLAFLCVGSLVLLDHTELIPVAYRPGFGLERCWFRTDRLVEFSYHTLPIMLILFANATFFTLTAVKIRRVQMEMARITSKEDSRRHRSQFEQEKDKYGLFLRLFIVMGVTWTMEVVSWIIEPTSWVFYLTDALNCFQGLFIFVLFVMKPKVKKLLVKRWKTWRGDVTDKRAMSYSGTQTTQVTSTNSVTASQQAENSLLPRHKVQPVSA